MIIDVHGHVGEYKRHYSETFARIIGGVFQQDPGAMWNIVPEDVVKDMDENGVDKMVILGLNITSSNLGTYTDPEYIYETYLKRWPDRFIAFAGVQPYDDLGFFSQERLSIFRHAVTELGFKGLKANPGYCGFYPDDKRMYPYYQACVEYKIPVLLHMGTTSFRPAKIDCGNPRYLEQPAKDFPDIKFCAAHFAYPWENDLLGLMRNCSNVWTDIAVQVVRPRQLARAISGAKEYGVIDRVMYGTDYPCSTQAQNVKFIKTDLNILLKEMGYTTISDEEIEGILWKNAKRYLDL